jgi:hypothetical protein
MPRRVSLALAAILAAGCGNDHEPSRPVSSLSLRVYTDEWEPEVRHIMVLGAAGSLDVATETVDGCFIESPCAVSVEVRVASSNPGVVSLDRQTVLSPTSLPLRAHAVGTATITAKVGNLSKSERVDVVETPLPLDDVQITLIASWNDLPSQYDASQSLTWMSVPVGQTSALMIAALRDGTRVFGIPLTVVSSAPGIAMATAGCRPPSLDPQCDVASDGWVVGVSPGDAQVTVTGRNITKDFTAHVDPS